jgi:hypothetical protein
MTCKTEKFSKKTAPNDSWMRPILAYFVFTLDDGAVVLAFEEPGKDLLHIFFQLLLASGG